MYLVGWAPHGSQQQPAKRGSATKRIGETQSSSQLLDEQSVSNDEELNFHSLESLANRSTSADTDTNNLGNEDSTKSGFRKT